ncbi:MAG: iron chelate uptake ABC transporter family permease subunit [Haemophilus parainfluenzae]
MALNLLALEEDEAKASYSYPTYALYFDYFHYALTASAVSITGLLAGLVCLCPISRDFSGCHLFLFADILLLGASFLLLTDTLARTVASIELPIGILTSACGASFFLYLLLRGRN